MIRNNALWQKNSVLKIDPEKNTLLLDNGSSTSFDYLVVAAGIQSDWDKIAGLTEALSESPSSGVVSIYHYEHAKHAAEAMKRFSAGRAIFTMPNTLIKCAGAPQKIMWLFEESLRDRGQAARDAASVEFWVPGAAMFGVKKYSDVLEALRAERGVKASFKKELVAVDGKAKVATFKSLEDGELTKEPFDLLHVVPPMSAPDFIKQSPLANAAGWVDVDKYSLQSTKYSHVFAIGDCSSTPNSKTAAAITKQAPIMVHNLCQVMKGELPNAK
jgi:sulfide:quinone oxidoreductase